MSIFSTAAAAARKLGLNIALKHPRGLRLDDGRFIQPLELIPGTNQHGPVPLCGTWSEKLHPHNAYGQHKVDGFRALFIQQRIISKEALPLDCAMHCIPTLVELEKLYGEPMVFDGEYQAREGFAATQREYKAREGEGIFHLFDAVPYSEWKANKFKRRLDDRLPELAEMSNQVDSTFVENVPLIPLGDAAHAQECASAFWAHKLEGIVVKSGSSRYYRGRDNAWLKLKRHQTCEGVITDAIVDGEMLKALLVRLPGGKVVKIGSGFSDDMRREVGQSAGRVTGAVVEIAFTDTTDTGALKGGYFVRLRPELEKK